MEKDILSFLFTVTHEFLPKGSSLCFTELISAAPWGESVIDVAAQIISSRYPGIPSHADNGHVSARPWVVEIRQIVRWTFCIGYVKIMSSPGSHRTTRARGPEDAHILKKIAELWLWSGRVFRQLWYHLTANRCGSFISQKNTILTNYKYMCTSI